MIDSIYDPPNHQLSVGDINSSDYASFLDGLTDVPEAPPLIPIAIDRAGISNQLAPLIIKSLFGEDYVTIECKVNMQVSLKGHRGIHMSRCEEALFRLSTQTHESLESIAEKLVRELALAQSSDSAFVQIEGTYFYPHATRMTRRESVDHVVLFAHAEIRSGTLKSSIGLSATNMTGCPCTKTYTKFAVVPELTAAGFSSEQVTTILDITNSGTHTQRGVAKIFVERTDQSLTHGLLLNVLDRSCHLVFDLLKRPDEHDLVLRALKKPQFTEDVVRAIVADFIETSSPQLDPGTEVFASSLLFDSIHSHDVYTEIRRSAGDLCLELDEAT
ncbi:GTP cyclohydrolase, FolE2/MptA family [Arthrobacter sp. 4R501]|uniref:GTP cyclohydrolase, FolE2/MptA family n=1 Tax=Arthrobacter sp. 4R501 TaxID=2058886 RepID=UPI0015E486FC|nr:GTP cyclohydrolase, FolE2/MptA family [Arthrobacter sp. 4R501]